MRRCFFLFPTTFDALRAEKTWPQTGYTGKLRPIPRVLSASCGLCLETEIPRDQDPLSLLQAHDLEWEQIVEIKDKDLEVVASNA